MNIKWTVDGVGSSVHLRQFYSSCSDVVCKSRLFCMAQGEIS
jgi:hypothetical protein